MSALEIARGQAEAARAERDAAAALDAEAERAVTAAKAENAQGHEDIKQAAKIHAALFAAENAKKLSRRRLADADALVECAEREVKLAELAELEPSLAVRGELAKASGARIAEIRRHRAALERCNADLRGIAERQQNGAARAAELRRELGLPPSPHKPLAPGMVAAFAIDAEFSAAEAAGEPVDLGRHVRALHQALFGIDPVGMLDHRWPLDEQRAALLAGTWQAESSQRQSQREENARRSADAFERRQKLRMIANMTHREAYDAIHSWSVHTDPEFIDAVAALAPKPAAPVVETRTATAAPRTVAA